MSSNNKRPAGFQLGVSDWKISYHKIDIGKHGETDKDLKEVFVYPLEGRSESVIKDTLLHECLHVCLEDIVDTVCKMDSDKPVELEEQLILLLTPRLHELFTNNKELREYIFTKSVDKSKKKK